MGEHLHRELLTSDDVGRLFDITVQSGCPELITDLVMPAYHLRAARTRSIEDELILATYDTDWIKLRERGEPEPIEFDPRMAIDEMKFVGRYNMRPSSLFRPRPEIVAIAQAEHERAVAELEKETLTTHYKLTEVVDNSAVDFILSLTGISISPSGIEFRQVNPEKLEQVRKVVILMDPVMRDIIRINSHIIEAVEPDLVEQLKGTPMDNPENERLLSLRKAAEAMINEWMVDPDDR